MRNILDFQAYKNENKKIAMVTCYDACFAKILNDSDVDCLLVGDTVATVLHGYDSTVHATMPMMEMHTKAVAKGAPNKFIVGDLPFLSYRKSLSEAVTAAGKLIQAGAHAVKLEGAEGNLELISHLVHSGIPVMGHLGLTPQSVYILGGHKVQGKTADAVNTLIKQAKALEEAGCFATVLECVPASTAKKITESIIIPTIGIGAGPMTDGQVLVLHDLLGLDPKFKPKFLKHFSQAYEQTLTAVNQFNEEVKTQLFPCEKEHSYQGENA